MRSSGPSKGGSPGRSGGSATRNASAAARAVGSAPATASPESGSLELIRWDRLADPHGLADLDHRLLRGLPRLAVAELDDVVEVLGAGEERLALLAHPLLV